ncbi:MAG TPA: hydantoinase/oxoprolinase family protein [Rhodopila sp.]|nr:hydantoinase/oxoprolinase family protein [Rhodopila sp.]
MQKIIGWDIGGAHVKAACIEGGRVVSVRQLACPLWLGADRLAPVLATLRAAFGPADLHVATMTGELADVFPDRRHGVLAIVDELMRALPVESLRFYAGRGGIVEASAVARHVGDIASANWHASAALAARHGDGLLVDIGSTTTDIVPLRDGGVCARGYTDAERLGCGELVYTGLTRAFVMAMGGRAPFGGAWTTLAAEYFASAADVHRILGTLDEAADQMESADGRAKTTEASRARLARMIGRDAGDAGDADWHGLAVWFAEMQLRQIHDGALLVLSGAGLPPDAPVVAAGVGGAIVRRLAERLGRRCVSFGGLFGDGAAAGGIDWVDGCAPAVAVALLASG